MKSLIIELLEALFIFFTALMAAYLIRHYIFTLTVVKNAKNNEKPFVTIGEAHAPYQPKVSILMPARNEERVIGRILQRMTELTYPKDKLQAIVVDDASTDKTGIIAEQYSRLALERIGGYRVDQEARDCLGLITQFGGTVGGFRRTLLESIGRWDENILAEDTDLTFRVYLAGYKVKYVSDAECYEEAVESWRAYWKQRYRWAKGHMQCAFKHWLSVLKSRKLKPKEKIDGLLLLNVYFLPVIVLFSWIIGVSLVLLEFSQWLTPFWTTSCIAIYSSIGNFAPFYEVGVGAYLDGRRRAQWLIPLLLFTLLYNIPICTKALADILASKIRKKNINHWEKTEHSGNGNRYIMNASKQ